MPIDTQPKRNRLVTNWVLSFLSWGFPLLIAFFATPIIIRGLGTEQYGLYALIIGFIGYTFSTGVGKVAAKYIPEYRASGEPERLSETMSAALWLAASVGLFEAVVLGALTPLLVSDVLLLPADSAQLIVWAMYVACLAGFSLTLSVLFQSAIQGRHRFDIYATVTSVSGLVSAAGSVLLVWKGYNVFSLVVWYSATTVLAAIAFGLTSWRLNPDWHPSLHVSRQTFAMVGRYAGSIVIYQTLNSALLAFERAWIVRKFGPEAVAYYAVPLMLALYMHGLLGSFVQVLFPIVNELLNDRDRLVRIYLRATKIMAAGTAFFAASFIGAGETFLRLWIGPDFAERSYELLVILSLAYACNIISMIAWLLAEAFKAPGLNAISSGLWTVVAIPLMVFFADTWQTEGIALGRFGGVLLTLPLVFYIELRFLGMIHSQFWAGMLIRLAPAVSAIILIERYLFGRYEASWPILILGVLTGTVAFGSILAVTGFFNREEISLALNRLPGWMRRAES